MDSPDPCGPDRDRVVPVNARFLHFEEARGPLQQPGMWQAAHFGLRGPEPPDREVAVSV